MSSYDNERLKRSAEIYSPLDASVTGTSTIKVEAKIGSEIWSDRGYSISSISDGLLGATLFQPNHTSTQKQCRLTQIEMLRFS